MHTRVEPRAALEVGAGLVLAFALASLLAVITEYFWGHRGTDKPLMIALAGSLLFEAACTAVLWRVRRRLAYGFAVYLGLGLLYMLAALTVFHRS